jgi:hypothetical protein
MVGPPRYQGHSQWLGAGSRCRSSTCNSGVSSAPTALWGRGSANHRRWPSGSSCNTVDRHAVALRLARHGRCRGCGVPSILARHRDRAAWSQGCARGWSHCLLRRPQKRTATRPTAMTRQSADSQRDCFNRVLGCFIPVAGGSLNNCQSACDHSGSPYTLPCRWAPMTKIVCRRRGPTGIRRSP